MNRNEIKNMLLTVARKAAGSGPGWSQESVVLREVGDTLKRSGGGDVNTEQAILEVWHDLFTTDRILAWGYDLNNPGSPFFHVRQPA